ncbi:hypothetical protein KBB96_19475 [Luteolibacter ambystomatis]|uniref:PEP-CTERM sorting domain-containing protein n=1 Tax=Luteolibacter ambystomatis TaxID=2824561 RepID=A0A975G909_9BACT|nr:hypothetical protein [Luteolibacter ambystomatis]QUE51023.1 hypothetical protein KBB96_19475 [Luteolibacter ambystomatis]
MTARFSILFLAPAVVAAGPYAPAPPQAATTAISKDDSRFVAWASGYWSPTYGPNVDATWKTPDKALGKAKGDSYDIVCLGDNGSITMWFPHPIRDEAGADFAVFENSFSATFLELGFVEVSSDGVNFFRFPTASLTASAVGGFGNVDPTNIDGFAGKYQQGYGTPFDLASVADSPNLDKQHVRFVRIVDVIGNGTAKDSSNRSIYDPYPTTGSGGFDLDAIGVIHQNIQPEAIVSTVAGGAVQLRWQSNPGSSYRVETSVDLSIWIPLETNPGPAAAGLATRTYPFVSGEKARYWRVVRIDP